VGAELQVCTVIHTEGVGGNTGKCEGCRRPSSPEARPVEEQRKTSSSSESRMML